MLWSRSANLPPWDNRLANQVLAEIVNRERMGEAAKMEYLGSIFAIIHGIDEKSLEKKMGAMAEMKKTLLEVLYHDAFSPKYVADKKRRKLQEKQRSEDMLRKVAEMGNK